MLIDAQQWDERNAAAQADREYKHTVLESNLVQREFENRMTEQRHVLQRNADVRADANLALAQKTQADNLAIRNEELELAKDNFGLSEDRVRMAKEKHVDEMRVLSAEADKATRPYQVVPLDFNQVTPEHLKESAAFMEDAQDLLGKYGGSVDERLQPFFINEEGQEQSIMMKRIDQQELLPALQGLIAKHTNPNALLKSKIEGVVAERDRFKAIANTSGDRNIREKAHAKRMVKKLDAQLKQDFAGFKPENVRDAYGRLASEAVQGANWMYGQGFDEQGTAMERQASEFLSKSLAADDAKKGQATTLYKTELTKDGKVQTAGYMANWDTVNEMWDWQRQWSQRVNDRTADDQRQRLLRE
jgi:hypothetical protein